MEKFAFLMMLLVLALCGSAFAEGDWTADFELAEGDPIACTILEPIADDEAMKAVLGEITDADWSIGPEDAPLTILEYADFQCPYCSRVGMFLVELQAAHPEDIRYVYRHFPLSFHTYAPTAAYASDAAGKQGLFFDAEHFLYEHQQDWSGLESVEAVDAWLRENFETAFEGLDFEQWVADYESEEIRATVDACFDAVLATGAVSGTPTLFVNYADFDGNMTEEYFMNMVELLKDSKSGDVQCPSIVVDDAHDYRAILDTTAGEIVIDLFADEAPAAVSNFITLAKNGQYDGVAFYNVIPGFVAQTGDKTGTGYGNPGYTFANEVTSGNFGEGAGWVAMANSGKDQNGSQFFISSDVAAYFTEYAAGMLDDETAVADNVAERVQLMNERYPIFGKVTEESLAVVDGLDTASVINGITIEAKEK